MKPYEGYESVLGFSEEGPPKNSKCDEREREIAALGLHRELKFMGWQLKVK